MLWLDGYDYPYYLYLGYAGARNEYQYVSPAREGIDYATHTSIVLVPIRVITDSNGGRPWLCWYMDYTK